ncbi:MAG: iron-containing alcohol dehydrogenase, partial [Nevskia sp.]|nr:iron-containing alcohol dehydrogenase [Nevskia sp.]
MDNFDYRNPTRILFGKGQIAAIDGEIPHNAKVLLTYGGGSIKRNGTYEQVKAALGARQVVEFGGIEPNPAFETMLEGVALARREKVDFVLAVGGGSVVDGSKFLSGAVFYEGDPWEIVLTRASVVTKALPVGTVLTLPATGSEMNGNAVITRRATKDKLGMASPLFFPRFSVLDPTVS